jgi:hypothetical protein
MIRCTKVLRSTLLTAPSALADRIITSMSAALRSFREGS